MTGPQSTVEPLLSVITVCLNRADTIAAALDSVARQLGAVPEGEIEHLVIDGGSTDGTLVVAARFPDAHVVSEPDTGLYDAMNKGVALARGRYVCFLNSDDELADGVLAAARPYMLTGHDVISAGTDFVRRNAANRHEVIETIVAPDAIALSPVNATLGSPLLNAKFFRRDFLRAVGQFDLRYKLASDVDLLLRAALNEPRQAVLPIVGHRYVEHAGSLTINPSGNNGRRAALECIAIADSTLEQPGLSRRTRGMLRAWRGGKRLMLALRDDRGLTTRLVSWVAVAANARDVGGYLSYLIRRKLAGPRGRQFEPGVA